MKFVHLYIELKCSFLVLLNLFFTVCIQDLLSILGKWKTNGITFLLFSWFGAGPWRFALKILLLTICSGYLHSFKNFLNLPKQIITFSGLNTKTIILLARL